MGLIISLLVIICSTHIIYVDYIVSQRFTARLTVLLVFDYQAHPEMSFVMVTESRCESGSLQLSVIQAKRYFALRLLRLFLVAQE